MVTLLSETKNSDVNFFPPNWYLQIFAYIHAKFERLEALLKGRACCLKADTYSRSAHQPETGRPYTNFILSQVTAAFSPRNHELVDTRSYVAISGIGLQQRPRIFFQSLPTT